MRSYRILVVEDDSDQIALIAGILKAEQFQVVTASSSERAREVLTYQRFDAVLLDFYLGDETCMPLLVEISSKWPLTKVIVLTAQGSIDLAVDCMEHGAASFLTKEGCTEKIGSLLRDKLMRTDDSAEYATDEWPQRFGLIGKSSSFVELCRRIEAASKTDATVLLLGESGTGKELLARAVHGLSQRKSNNFEAVNCAAMPETLLEAELFGYRRGAFTDARTDHKGLFEVCTDGTLFLDELGEMPGPMQAKLLRVLECGEIRPLGVSHARKVKTRIVAATNKDLADLVKAGQFREDLWYRLSILPIMIPPLRERKDDIHDLTAHFLKICNKRYSKAVSAPCDAAAQELLDYDWPGNIRELWNLVERSVILATDNEFIPHLHPLMTQKDSPKTGSGAGAISAVDGETPINYEAAKESFERSYLRKLLEMTKGNLTEAARVSGRVRSEIYRLIGKYGLSQDDFRDYH